MGREDKIKFYLDVLFNLWSLNTGRSNDYVSKINDCSVSNSKGFLGRDKRLMNIMFYAQREKLFDKLVNNSMSD